jgi:hypothetical protein
VNVRRSCQIETRNLSVGARLILASRRFFLIVYSVPCLHTATTAKKIHGMYFREKTEMRAFQISDELYEQMKRFIVDPFDDTPDVVIQRLIEIADKARNRWSPFESNEGSQEPVAAAPAPQARPMGRRGGEDVIL